MTINVTGKVQVTLQMSPVEMGVAFSEMDSQEQARFFQGVEAGTKKYDRPACFQWSMMREELEAYPDALKCFQEMAEYAIDEAT